MDKGEVIGKVYFKSEVEIIEPIKKTNFKKSGNARSISAKKLPIY
jgi:hypothetical protein